MCPIRFSTLLCRAAVMADWLLDRVMPGLGRIYFTATYRKPAQLDTGESGMVQGPRSVGQAA